MSGIFGVQVGILWVLAVIALGFQVFALLDAVRQRTDAFPATGNQTKTIWLAILGVAVALGVVSLPNFMGPLNLFNLLALVAAGVYLARVRPAIRDITGRSSSGGW